MRQNGDQVLILPDKTYVNAAGGADRRHLNAERTPDDALSPTDFKYLTTDGTADGTTPPYLKSQP